MPDTDVTINLHAWTARTAARYTDYEQHEMAMYPDDQSRDAAIVAWVVRCLANPDCDGSAEVLDAIREQRVMARCAS